MFPSWVLFEAARGCYNAFEKKWGMLKGPPGIIQKLGETVDFLHPRLCNSSVLACIIHGVNAVTTALFDGVDLADMRVLLLEVTKLCVVRMHFNIRFVPVLCQRLCLFDGFYDTYQSR